MVSETRRVLQQLLVQQRLVQQRLVQQRLVQQWLPHTAEATTAGLAPSTSAAEAALVS